MIKNNKTLKLFTIFLIFALKSLFAQLCLHGLVALRVVAMEAEGGGAEDEKKWVSDANVPLGHKCVPEALTLFRLVVLLTKSQSESAVHWKKIKKIFGKNE